MVLNTVLYNRINRLLEGGVRRVVKEGELAVLKDVTNIRTRQRYTQRLAGGEEYVTNCPFCGDTRGRLYINYRYGTVEEDGAENCHLAICFNESCLQNEDNRDALHDKLCCYLLSARNRPLTSNAKQGGVVSREGQLRTVPLPGRILPLSELRPDHYAVKYLRERQYDLNDLMTHWNIGVCTDSDQSQLIGRIFIPIYMHGNLVGWQGRWPADIEWKKSKIPKYYNLVNMPRRLMLYNYDKAKDEPIVVICEGVTDVWRVGLPGVALLGKTMSPQQAQLVVQAWGEKTIIVCLDANDPDAAKAAESITSQLKAHVPGDVYNVRLPDGLDPGSCSREQLWDIIVAQTK